MKVRKFILFFVIVILVLSQVFICCAASKTESDENHKFYGGYNTDYGPQVWNITTELTVDYTASSSNKNLKKYWIYAAGSPHAGIPEGNYYFPNGMKTYSGGSLIGTDYRKTFSYYDIIYDPAIAYPYMHGNKTVSYSVPSSKTAKVQVECMFNVDGWTPIPGTSWWNTLTVSI